MVKNKMDIVTIPSTTLATTFSSHGVQSDSHLIEMWLGTTSPGTRKTYRQVIGEFQEFLHQKPLQVVTVADLDSYKQSLEASLIKTSTQVKKLSAVRSLFSYGQKLGYLQFNVGAPIKLPKIEDELASKITSEESIFHLVEQATSQRDYLLIRLIYHTGMRTAEACRLQWKDMVLRADVPDVGCQLTIHGKGTKTRQVLCSTTVTRKLDEWRQVTIYKRPDDYIFATKRGHGSPMNTATVWKIVKKIASRAGLPANFTTHWLRHAHVTHTLDRGAPLSLVKETVGHTNINMTDRYNQVNPKKSSTTYAPL